MATNKQEQGRRPDDCGGPGRVVGELWARKGRDEEPGEATVVADHQRTTISGWSNAETVAVARTIAPNPFKPLRTPAKEQ